MSKQKQHLKRLNEVRSKKADSINRAIADDVRMRKIDNPNLSLSEIAELLGKKYNAVYSAYRKYYPKEINVLKNGSRDYGKNNDGHNKRQSIPDSDLQSVIFLYVEQKFTLRQIGEKYSCTAGAVLNFFKKHNIQRRTVSEAAALVWNDAKREEARKRGINNYINANKTDTLPERMFKNWVIEKNIKYISQYRQTGIDHPYDFFLPDFNLLVEIDGTFWHSLPVQKEKDLYQVQHANKKGYNIVRIDATDAMREHYDFTYWIMEDKKWNKTSLL